MNLEMKPRIRADIQHQELDDGAVLFDPKSERVHTLNASAAYIWNSCDGVNTLQGICSDLAAAANIPEEKALKDVLSVVKEFEREMLLSE